MVEDTPYISCSREKGGGGGGGGGGGVKANDLSLQ